MSISAEHPTDLWVAPIDPDAATTPDHDHQWLTAKQAELRAGQAPAHPLGDRLRSCARIAREVDDFFRFRSARLDELVAGGFAEPADAQHTLEVLEDMRATLGELAAGQDEAFVAHLGPDLAAAGVHLIGWDELSADERAHLGQLFERRIFPVLTPLAVDPGHPFPYISDLSLNLAVVLEDPDDHRRHFARVKVPGSLNRFVGLPGRARFVPLEQVIVAHLDRLFLGMTVIERHPFRVTRDAGVVSTVADSDSKRSQAGRAVRLEVHESMSIEVRQLLQRELDLDDEDVYQRIAPLDMGWLASVAELADPTPAPPLGRRRPRVALWWVAAVIGLLVLLGIVVLVA